MMRMSKPLRSLILLLSAYLAQATAYCEEWRLIPEFQGQTLQVDNDSVHLISTAPVKAEVRWRKGGGAPTEEFRSVIECSSFKVVNDRMPSLGVDATIDSPKESRTRVVFAFYGTVEGGVADYACRMAAPKAWQDLLASSMCDKSEYSNLPTCRDGTDLRINTVLLVTRALDLSEVCGETSEGTQRVLHRYVDEANYCRDNECARKTILEGLGLVSRDFETRANSQASGGANASCHAVTVVTEDEAKKAAQKAGEETLRKYVSCTRSKIPEVDDGSSPPEGVARQIHQACESLFVTAVRSFGGDEHNSQFYESMFPRLVSDVIRNRSRK